MQCNAGDFSGEGESVETVTFDVDMIRERDIYESYLGNRETVFAESFGVDINCHQVMVEALCKVFSQNSEEKDHMVDTLNSDSMRSNRNRVPGL